jgi:hypothetical protein
MLNTFFFGYLSLKWRRLFRTLITLAYFFWGLYSFYEVKVYNWVNGEYIISYSIEGFILLISIPTISIPLISWVIKPFVVKEN